MPLTPLYQNPANAPHTQSSKASGSTDGNTGLWFNKFCNTWSRDPKGTARTSGSDNAGGSDNRNEPLFRLAELGNKTTAKQQWLDDTVAHYEQRKDVLRPRLEQAAERQRKLANAQNSMCISVESTSSFVTGMGNSNPVENGFTFHHTLGVPYLPGSSLKGVLRHWFEYWCDNSDSSQSSSTLIEYFGNSQGQQTQVGGLIFLDAVPYEMPEIVVDIMTPHYGQWYSHGGSINEKAPNTDAIPAGWHNPVPIPFLVVKEIKFDIIIMRQKSMSNEAWQRAESEFPKLLDEALSFIGAGAKTAVGYGYFKTDSSRSQQISQQLEQQREQSKQHAAEQLRLSQMSSLERQFEADVLANNKLKAPFIVAAIKLLESGHWKDQQAPIAAIIQQRMQASTVKNYQWKPSSQSKKPEKDKAHQNTIKVLAYLDEKT
jgi:CRISPR-associated protein Cmr6